MCFTPMGIKCNGLNGGMDYFDIIKWFCEGRIYLNNMNKTPLVTS